MIGLWRESEGKNIKREINMLKEQFRSTELKPCYGDADLERKDKDLLALREEIYSLEKEIDRFAFPIISRYK